MISKTKNCFAVASIKLDESICFCFCLWLVWNMHYSHHICWKWNFSVFGRTEEEDPQWSHNLQNESSWYWRTKRLVLKFSRECFNIFVWPVGSKHWTKLFKYWTSKLVVLAAAANQLVPCSKQCDFFQITCQDCIILSFMTKLVIYIFFFTFVSQLKSHMI